MKKQLLIASMAITTAFCGALGFTACGGGSDDDGKKDEITLTAHTDFTSLVSEKVDEAGWKKAFALKDYTVNFTCGFKENWSYEDTKYDRDFIFKYNVNELFYYSNEKSPQPYTLEASIKLADGVYSYYYYDYNLTKEDARYLDKANANDAERAEIFEELYNYYMVMYYPDFSNNFSSFTYDESKHSYVCADTVEGTSIMEDGTEDYENVEIKIVNGKLAYVSCDGGNYVSCFYDFGNTTITYKNVEEIIGALG